MWWRNYRTLSRFHKMPKRNGWTDRRTEWRTDRIAVSITRVSVLTRDKNLVNVVACLGDRKSLVFVFAVSCCPAYSSLLFMIVLRLYESQEGIYAQNKTNAAARSGKPRDSYCATPRPFSMATSKSLILCLYLAYSKLLKLTAASNADGVWKMVILDE